LGRFDSFRRSTEGRVRVINFCAQLELESLQMTAKGRDLLMSGRNRLSAQLPLFNSESICESPKQKKHRQSRSQFDVKSIRDSGDKLVIEKIMNSFNSPG